MYIRHNKVIGNLGIRTCSQELGNKQKYSQSSSILCQLEKRHIMFLKIFKETTFLSTTINRI